MTNDIHGRELKSKTADLSVGQLEVGIPLPAEAARPLPPVISAVETGIELTVVPTIGGQMINMDLGLRLASVSGYDGSGRPLLNSRQITDSIAVAADDEVIFGGLTRERKVQSTHKVPILGSIPVLGYLFGGEITMNQKSIVVAAVRPHLIVDSTNVTEKDNKITRQAAGEEAVVLPASEFCFDQSVSTTF